MSTRGVTVLANTLGYAWAWGCKAELSSPCITVHCCRGAESCQSGPLTLQERYRSINK